MRLFGKRPPPSATLMGKIIQVGGYELKVESHLGEGGFASIYRVRDSSTSEEFALKHIRLGDGGTGGGQTRREVCHEAKSMKKVRGHPNVLGLVAVAFGGGVRGEETDAYLLMDLCTDTLYEFLQSKEFKLEDTEVLKIMESTCKAVQHMHSQSPPIAHRDIKVENVLRRPNGDWVLCDYGSASSSVRRFQNAADSQAEEEYLSKKTTPAYRAPEMWDLMMGHVIDTKVDIWALGCMLYLLCFGKLPFTGDSKLQVLSGKFVMPATRPSPLRSLISSILIADPNDRPDIHQVLQRVQSTQDAVVSGDYSATASLNPITRPSSTVAIPTNASPFSQANGDPPRVPPLDMAPTCSLPNPDSLNKILCSSTTPSQSPAPNGRLHASGELHRSMSMGQSQDWTASFNDSNWPTSGPQHDSEAAGGMAVGVPADQRNGKHPPLSPPLNGHRSSSVELTVDVHAEVRSIRETVEGLVNENASLSSRVHKLEHLVASQHHIIQELLRGGLPSYTPQIPKDSAPLSARVAPPGGFSAFSAVSEPSGSNDAHGQRSVTPVNKHHSGSPTAQDGINGKTQMDGPSHSSGKVEEIGGSQLPGGTFWEQYADSSEAHLTRTIPDVSMEPDSTDSNGMQTPNGSDATATHRRIVSDPPPIESWHLSDVEFQDK